MILQGDTGDFGLPGIPGDDGLPVSNIMNIYKSMVISEYVYSTLYVTGVRER